MATEYKLLFGLENQFVDTTGETLVGGYLYAYKASDHITFKNIASVRTPTIPADFYANPMNIGADGCPPEPCLFYLANDEAYYLVLTNANQNPLDPPDLANIVRTWDNVQPNEQSSPQTDEVDYTNYILNSQYRFHRKSSYTQADFTVSTKNYIADNGWFFYTDQIPASMSISFETFTPGQTDVPNYPKTYLSYVCNSVGTSETIKDIFIDMNDVRSFNGETIQIAFWAKSSFNTQIELLCKQDFGSGGSTPVTILNSVQLTGTWTQYFVEVSVPSILGKTIGSNEGFYVGFRAPLNAIAAVDIVNWQLNRGDQILEYNYKTKEIEASTKRTYYMPDPSDDDIGLPIKWNGSAFVFDTTEIGRIRSGFELTIDGYHICDGTSLSTLDYYAGTKLSYSRLYDHWYNAGLSNGGNIFGYGTDGFVNGGIYSDTLLLINSIAGTSVTTWTDHDTGFTITEISSGTTYVISSLIAFFGELEYIDHTHAAYKYYGNEGYISVVGGTAGAAGTSGFTVDTNNGNQQVYCIAGATLAGKYFTIDTATTNYYIWYKVDGAGADPTVAGRTGILVDVLSTDPTSYVALKTYYAINGHHSHSVQCVAASALSGGEYFNFYNSTTHYAGYIKIDGVGTAPTVAGATNIPIEISSGDTAAQVAAKVQRAISRIFFNLPDMRGLVLRGTDNGRGLDPDAHYRDHYGSFTVGDTAGTLQRDEFRTHRHIVDALSDYGANPFLGGGEGAAHGYPSTEYSGGNETRMVNMSINYFVKL